MHRTGAFEVEQPQIEQDERWQLAQRILQSETFRRSPRLRSFLLYVVENTLRHRTNNLSEHLIGLEVFSRPVDYNPLEDSIVRSSARQLRAKLHEFFASEGSAEATVLDIPKGAYVAEFVPKISDRSSSTSEIVRLEVQHQAGIRRREWIWIGGMAVLAGILAAVLLRDRLPGPHGNSSPPPNLIFSVFSKPQEITIVLSDAALVTVNDQRSSVLTLQGYENKEEQDLLPSSLRLRHAGSSVIHRGRIITSFRDALFAAQLAVAAEAKGYQVQIRHSRLMHTRDFQSGNFILLGSTSSNPWVDLFEDRFNFQFGTDLATGLFGLRNLHPLTGELPFYSSSTEQRRNGNSQARIALTQNLSETGKVLLISGICSESSEGATEAVLSPDFPKAVDAMDENRPVASLSQFELITEVVSVDGVVRTRRLIASRFR
jgi:hypothetical protein